MILTVDHTTKYNYSEAVRRSVQVLRLSPHESSSQKILDWNIEVPGKIFSGTDGYGNITNTLYVEDPHIELKIRVQGRVEVLGQSDGEAQGHLHPFLFLRQTPRTEPDEAIKIFAEAFREKIQRRPLVAIQDLADAILEVMPFCSGITHSLTTASEALQIKGGVCQDHTHLFVSVCRYLGIPARYISGYIWTENENHVAMHAWGEAWIGQRWVAFDITNRSSDLDQHIRLAHGLDYVDVSPIRGSRLGGGSEALHASVHVAHEDQ
jgi:transglutaminase-like putative cysteine protease